MVSNRLKSLRDWVPIIGIIALLGMFLKLPEAPNILGLFKCKTCLQESPYLSLIGAGYFSALIAASLLFPSFPSIHMARGGMIWAVLLAFTLTYIHLPNWCVLCLLCHLCNSMIWTIWMIVPSETTHHTALPFRERLYLMMFGSITIVALFSCLNLTLLIYGLRHNHDGLAASLKPGDSVPMFTAKTNSGYSVTNADLAQTNGIVINFISPDCPFCKEQLAVLSPVATQLAGESYRFINVSPLLSLDLIQQLSSVEWVEDTEGKLRELFKVKGYPTLFVLGSDGKILEVIPGVSDQLKVTIINNLIKQNGS